MKTHEGAKAYNHAISNTVEFFSKAGSVFETPRKNEFYHGSKSVMDMFIPSFNEDAITSMKLSMWLRDCRGGAGNRSGARKIIEWLGNKHTDLMRANMHFIPVHGRWDDLVALFKTPLREEAGSFWAGAIQNGDILAAKWAKRHYKPIRLALGMKEAEFRKLLSSIRKDHIVEHLMCQKKWDKIQYSKVPSVAMARYTRAFDKNDNIRFQRYKDALLSGDATVHASTLFPHDCIRTANHGDTSIAEAQFNALPDYLEGTDEQIMVICDTSGSMSKVIGGKIRAIDVSQGMALYCSSRLPEDSPFYKRFIAFGSESKFVDWRKHNFASALRSRKVFNGAVASTRIDKALLLILNLATERNIPQNLMPTTLLIVSDMQFTDGATNSFGWDAQGLDEKEALTEIDRIMDKFLEAGYEIPKIVYWNTDSYDGQQSTVNSNNVGLVSGFSPSICKAIFGGDDFSPYAIMIRALEKYEVIVPKND